MPRGRRSGRPNDYDWEMARGSSLGTAVNVITQFESFVSDTAETLVRVRGEVLVWLDLSGSAAGDVMVFAWGIVRSASGSTDVGVSPITEGGANFLAYGICTLGTEIAIGTAGDGNVRNGIAMKRFEIDSKAMRKLRENESIYMIFETADVVGAPVTNAGFAIRALTAR